MKEGGEMGRAFKWDEAQCLGKERGREEGWVGRSTDHAATQKILASPVGSPIPWEVLLIRGILLWTERPWHRTCILLNLGL